LFRNKKTVPNLPTYLKIIYVQAWARSLLENGVSVDVLDINGWTPLHTACLHGGHNRHAIVELLLDFGANINLPTPQAKRCALHLAVVSAITNTEESLSYVEDVDLVKILVRRGADLEAVDSAGLTPLLMTADCGRPQCLSFLLTCGAKMYASSSSSGCNALHYAVSGSSRDHEKCAHVLSNWDGELGLLKAQRNKRGHVPGSQSSLRNLPSNKVSYVSAFNTSYLPVFTPV
jgi:ankyrin repeat protein